jgi:O-succinylbenzoic acid--CoA ligase
MTISDFIAEWYSEVPYIMAHSSGSTGAPKPIQLPKTLVEASAKRTVEFFNITSLSRLHLPLDIAYIAGKMMVVRSIISGAKLTYEPASNRPLASNTDPQPIDLLAVVPSQLPYILDNRGSLPQIRNLLIGGSAIPADLRKRVAECGIVAYESYGMTETASHVALRRVTADALAPFKMLSGLSCSQAEDTALVITMDNGDVVRTKDSVEILSSSEFIYKGRLDNVINSGGIKIYPEEVEAEISQLLTPDFWREHQLSPLPFYISKRPSLKWGEEVVMYVEVGDSNIAVDTTVIATLKTAIISALKPAMPPYHLPKDILFIPRFSRTYNGKIIRK